MKKRIYAFLVSGVLISVSEFARNELAFKSSWMEKYSSNGMVFPSEPINNALWGLWSFMLAGSVMFLRKRIRFVETIVVAWSMAFVMMWIVIGNLNVLPSGLLIYVVPWSFLEVTVAAWLAGKIRGI